MHLTDHDDSLRKLNLTPSEIDYIEEYILPEGEEQLMLDYLKMRTLLDRTLTPERILNTTTQSRIHSHDALYHFRTIWMSLSLQLLSTGSYKTPRTVGVRPTLQQSNFNNLIAYSDNFHVLDIDPDIWTLLGNTTNTLIARRMPYPSIFINRLIELAPNIYCFGISAVYSETHAGEFGNFISVLGYDYNDNSHWRFSFSLIDTGIYDRGWVTDSIELFNSLPLSKARDTIATYFVNIMDFCNHPHVELKASQWYNNDARLTKGKLPIPKITTITINGTLRKYIDTHHAHATHLGPAHAHWVRGHYIHFWNQQRWKRLYSINDTALKTKGYQKSDTGLISRWKLPFIRGSGSVTKATVLLKIPDA